MMDAAALDQLAGDAKAADAPAPEQPNERSAAPAAPLDLARAWAEIPATLGAGLTIAMPELAPVYTDAACLAWGEAMIPIAAKYGWTPGKIWPWLRLLNATGAFAIPTFHAFRARIQAAQQPEQPPQDKPAAPAA